MSTKRNKKTAATILWQDEADHGLRGVLTTALGRDPDHDIRWNRHAIRKGGRGAGTVALYSVSSQSSTSAACYGDVRRGLIEVASQLAALQEEEAFHVTAENFVASLVGLHVECGILNAEGKRNRSGMTSNPDEAHKAALAAEGVRPVMRQRSENGSKGMVACEPINPNEPRWAKAVDAMAVINSQYGGYLGMDSEGVERTAKEVCEDVVKRQKEMKARNKKANDAAKEDKANGIVKLPAMKAKQSSLDAFIKVALAAGVDIEDLVALGEFACGAAVLAYAGTTETPKAKSA